MALVIGAEHPIALIRPAGEFTKVLKEFGLFHWFLGYTGKRMGQHRVRQQTGTGMLDERLQLTGAFEIFVLASLRAAGLPPHPAGTGADLPVVLLLSHCHGGLLCLTGNIRRNFAPAALTQINAGRC